MNYQKLDDHNKKAQTYPNNYPPSPPPPPQNQNQYNYSQQNEYSYNRNQNNIGGYNYSRSPEQQHQLPNQNMGQPQIQNHPMSPQQQYNQPSHQNFGQPQTQTYANNNQQQNQYNYPQSGNQNQMGNPYEASSNSSQQLNSQQAGSIHQYVSVHQSESVHYPGNYQPPIYAQGIPLSPQDNGYYNGGNNLPQYNNHHIQHNLYNNLDNCEYPSSFRCNFCQRQGVSQVTVEPGQGTYVCCCLLCCFGGLICGLIPFCTDSCQDKKHFCPYCGAQVGFKQYNAC